MTPNKIAQFENSMGTNRKAAALVSVPQQGPLPGMPTMALSASTSTSRPHGKLEQELRQRAMGTKPGPHLLPTKPDSFKRKADGCKAMIPPYSNSGILRTGKTHRHGNKQKNSAVPFRIMHRNPVPQPIGLPFRPFHRGNIRQPD